MNFYSGYKPRRSKLSLSSFTNNYIRDINPFMPMWWAMAMPGAGHIMIGKYIKGFTLLCWEYFVNTQADLNMAIVYSCIGQFEMAKDILDIRWFFIYIGVYIFNIWDAYRVSLDTSLFSKLAIRENAPLSTFTLSPVEINYLNKINIWIPVFWSLVTPGLGHIIIRNLVVGVFLLVWYAITVYQSHLLEAVYYTAYGLFPLARKIVNYHWLLFLPSLYLFSVCDSYYRAIETNHLFILEQGRYLKRKFGVIKHDLF